MAHRPEKAKTNIIYFMEEKREKLFAEFPEVTTDRWMEEVTKDLKGVPFEKKLVWRTKEGFSVNPFYRAEDIKDLPTKDSLPGEFPYVRGTKATNDWLVRQEVVIDGDFAEANAKVKRILGLGITAVGLHFKKDQLEAKNIQAVLEGVDLSKAEVNFYSCPKRADVLAAAVVEALKALGANLEEVRGSIGFNPFRHLLAKGERWEGYKEIGEKVLETVKPLKKFTCLTVDSLLFVNAGAYIYQELGYALSQGAQIIAAFSGDKFTAEEVAKRIRFDMGVSTNYFMEIAKFRAARWLWALIVKQNAPDATCATKALIHAETSMWNKTVYDAYVNLLRTTTESMSATLAGVHSLTVAPFDIAYTDKFEEFDERIARNQQLLLKEESHFDKVVDPAGGSYYIESLTNSIAEQAWKLFLETEEMGGFFKAAYEGKVQEAINASNDERHKAIATRKEKLLGTNIFPNFTEKIGHDKGSARRNLSRQGKDVTALDFRRGGSDFEDLRIATEKTGKAPKVFMLTIGNLAMRLARSQFASNFFATAGYELIDNLGFKTVEEGVDAAVKAGADIVVLCSSDDEYAEYAPQAHDLLKGRIPLVVAGAPANMDELKAKGIEHFIHVKVNVLETMQKFSEMLGIKA